MIEARIVGVQWGGMWFCQLKRTENEVCQAK